MAWMELRVVVEGRCVVVWGVLIVWVPESVPVWVPESAPESVPELAPEWVPESVPV